MVTEQTQTAHDLLTRYRKAAIEAAREYAVFLGAHYERVNIRLVVMVMEADRCPEWEQVQAEKLDPRLWGPVFRTDEWEACGSSVIEDDRQRGTNGGSQVRWWRLKNEYRKRYQ